MYKPTIFIGMLSKMFVYCFNCDRRQWHTLMAQSTYDYYYQCDTCNSHNHKSMPNQEKTHV